MAITLKHLDAPGTPVQLQPVQATAPAPKASGCCGGAAPEGADACCALDADVKVSGGSGCGCGTTDAAPPTSSGCC